MQHRNRDHWSKTSSDPNSREVLSHRKQQLSAARRKELILDRTEYFCHIASGKKVLDVGIVEHCANASANDNWLHKKICEHAYSCLGVDILETEIASLARQGFNVIVWDFTEKALPNKFDLIIAGDVIEHMENPTAFFRNLSQMLNPDGRIVISTPNLWYANPVFKNFREGAPFSESADHVGWFDAGTLCEIASRSGLILDQYSGVKTVGAGTFTGSIFFKLYSLFIWLGLRPEFFAKSMVYEFTLPDEK